MKEITASELKDGQAFRKPGQRKWRIAALILPVPPDVTLDGQPGLLVCLRDCSQIELRHDDVIIVGEGDELENGGFVKTGPCRGGRK